MLGWQEASRAMRRAGGVSGGGAWRTPSASARRGDLLESWIGICPSPVIGIHHTQRRSRAHSHTTCKASDPIPSPLILSLRGLPASHAGTVWHDSASERDRNTWNESIAERTTPSPNALYDRDEYGSKTPGPVQATHMDAVLQQVRIRARFGWHIREGRQAGMGHAKTGEKEADRHVCILARRARAIADIADAHPRMRERKTA
ncbi:hypothetical protein BJ912DRAFT_1149583 [Pholiota molesta]|nr:hypothetical protein BJ912DRAFT_1149583 [Pholiota molesta]